jgi:hypothetical protein
MKSSARKFLIWFIAVLAGCGPISPRSSLEERRVQRGQEFEQDAKNYPVIVAAWNLKEKLKKDYAEVIGPSKAYDEKIELQFSNALNEAMLETPGQYEKMAASWAKNRSDPAPTREEIREIIKTLQGRIKTLDGVIAQEVALAEEQAKEDAARRQKIIQVIAAIAVVALALAGGVAIARSGYQPSYNSTAMGPYIITRTGPHTTTVLTPSHRLYTCTTSGTYQVSVVNCF